MRIPTILALLAFAACSAPRHLDLLPQVPPLASEGPRADLERDAGKRASTDLSPPLPMPAEPVEFGGGSVTYRTVVEVQEAPPPPAPEPEYRYVDRYVSVDDYGYRGGVGYGYGGYGYRRRGPWFPINTAVGAGLGAIIGHQSGRRGRGAWIGGGVGLLLDLNRRWW